MRVRGVFGIMDVAFCSGLLTGSGALLIDSVASSLLSADFVLREEAEDDRIDNRREILSYHRLSSSDAENIIDLVPEHTSHQHRLVMGPSGRKKTRPWARGLLVNPLLHVSFHSLIG